MNETEKKKQIEFNQKIDVYRHVIYTVLFAVNNL